MCEEKCWSRRAGLVGRSPFLYLGRYEPLSSKYSGLFFDKALVKVILVLLFVYGIIVRSSSVCSGRGPLIKTGKPCATPE